MLYKDRIKSLRLEKGMTQRELAEKLGIWNTTIAMYENGSRIPSVKILIKMRDIFHSSIDYILGF